MAQTPEEISAYNAAYYQRTKERDRARKRKNGADYRARHPERNKKRHEDYERRNAEKRRQYHKERYKKKKAHILANNARWRKENPDKKRQINSAWWKDNPEKVLEHNTQRRSKTRQLPHTWTPEEQAFMFQYWHFACAVCGRERGFFSTLAADHWIPLSSPDCPGTIAENMIPLCHGEGGCNNAKHARDPHEWLLEKFGPRKAAQLEKAIAAYFVAVRTAFPLTP